jgi:hypothetical protein
MPATSGPIWQGWLMTCRPREREAEVIEPMIERLTGDGDT